MARSKRLRLARSPFTPILTETTPFELPVSFSNVGLYEYLISRRAKFTSSGIDLGPRDPVNYLLVSILFGKEPHIDTKQRDNPMSVKLPLKRTSPLRYRVRHDRHGYRELSVPHPGAQIAVAHFYDRYGPAMLQYLRRPSFSVRTPVRRASVVSVRDSIFSRFEDKARHGVESDAREYEFLTSYYRYREHRFIFKLFSSAKFRRLERKFPYVLALDVERCFESFYTHSASWAYDGRERVKRKSTSISRYQGSLGDRMDRTMQSMNDLETRGLLIGPEFSRLFAEVVFQSADREIEDALRASGLSRGDDFEILRYVDDYFAFASTEEVAHRVQSAVDRVLSSYRLYLNHDKSDLSATPRLNQLDSSRAAVRTIVGENLYVEYREETGNHRTVGRVVARTNRIRQEISGVISQSTDVAGPLASYAVSLLEERASGVLSELLTYVDRYSALPANVGVELTRNLSDLVELYFWLYDLAPRVANAVKVVRSLAEVRKACAVLVPFRANRRELDTRIAEACIATMERFELTEDNSIESLFFLDLMADAWVDTRLAERALRAVGVRRDARPQVPTWFNPLVVFELMRVASRSTDLAWAHRALADHALAKVQAREHDDVPDASVTFFALGLLASPFVGEATKLKVARSFSPQTKMSDVSVAAGVASNWFVEWGQIDLHERLLRKRVRDIY